MSIDKGGTLNCKRSKEMEHELKSCNMLKSILGTAPFGVNLWNKDMLSIMCNAQILNAFDIENEEEFLDRFYEFSPEFQPNGVSSKEMSRINFELALKNGKHIFNWMHITPNGDNFPCEITLVKLEGPSDEVYVVGFIKDLRAEFDYEQNNINYDFYFTDKLPKSVLVDKMSELTSEWYCTFDLRTGNLQYYGKQWFRAFGMNTQITENKMFELNFIHEDDVKIFNEMMDNAKLGITNSYEIRFLNDSGNYRYNKITSDLIFDSSGNPVFVVGKGIDIHDQRIIEERSQKDLLTDCYNKISAENIISEKLASNNSASHTLFIMDIDDFKSINDNLGHFFGDEVLKDIAMGLKNAFRDVDIISRIGGDEFIVFVENLSDEKLILEKAKKILEVYRKTYSGEYKDYSVSGSVGIAVFPRDGGNYEELYQNADKALNQAKIQGKNRFLVYSSDFNIGTSERSTTKIENANRMASSFFDYDLISTAFNILYEKDGSPEAINLTLSYLCEKYGADRSYIFESFDNGETYDNTFEYCKEGISSEINNLQGLERKLFGEFIEKAHDNILYSNDLNETFKNENAFELMANQGILSFAHAQIKRDGEMTFFVGLDDCTKTRIWSEREINSLQYIGKLLSIILQGTSLRAELNELTNTLTTKLNDEHFLMDCIEMLHSGNEPNNSLYSLLEAVASYYDAERSYIFEVSECGNFISNTYEYCKSGHTPYKDNLQNLPIDELSFFLNNCKTQGSFHLNINEVGKDSLEYELMALQNLTDIIIGAIQTKDNEVTGFVGVDNSMKNQDKTSIISTVAKFTATFLDETDYVTKLNKLSYYDTLTGAKNRHSYNLALKEIDKDIDSLGVLYVDIMRLRLINESKGINFGDSVLIKLSNILHEIFNDSVFRVGGDEFVILSENISEHDFEQQIVLLKDKLALEKDFNASIGYTWNRNFGYTSNDLSAMNAGGTYGRILLENLENEIKSGKYIVYIQPQVTLSTGAFENAEALVRRIGAGGVLQAPVHFLPFYEKEGIISRIDEFVFETVCKAMKSWKDSGVQVLPTMSVNCSRMTISKEGIVENFANICDNYGIDRSKLVIEITETINGLGEDYLAEIIKKFSAAGFLVSLDDFGSGYSNLNSLIASDFDEIKIDMKIINGVHKDKNSKLLTKTSIYLCNGLDSLSSVAEGVESKLQHDTLCEMGCNLGQGYYYAKPMPIDEFTKNYIKL